MRSEYIDAGLLASLAGSLAVAGRWVVRRLGGPSHEERLDAALHARVIHELERTAEQFAELQRAHSELVEENVRLRRRLMSLERIVVVNGLTLPPD
jgi:hypothetical protein